MARERNVEQHLASSLLPWLVLVTLTAVHFIWNTSSFTGSLNYCVWRWEKLCAHLLSPPLITIYPNTKDEKDSGSQHCSGKHCLVQ
ncbi:hypothetical protein GN956_G1477 [Arapaima gigas]